MSDQPNPTSNDEKTEAKPAEGEAVTEETTTSEKE